MGSFWGQFGIVSKEFLEIFLNVFPHHMILLVFLRNQERGGAIVPIGPRGEPILAGAEEGPIGGPVGGRGVYQI